MAGSSAPAASLAQQPSASGKGSSSDAAKPSVGSPTPDLSLDEIKALTDTSRISALLKQLNQHEQRVDHELDVLLSDKDRLQRSMCSLMRLKYVAPQLHLPDSHLSKCDEGEFLHTRIFPRSYTPMCMLLPIHLGRAP